MQKLLGTNQYLIVYILLIVNILHSDILKS